MKAESKKVSHPAHTERGVTVLELMITVGIIAVAIGLVTPTIQTTLEKRRLVQAAEDIANFVAVAQSLAVATNEPVTVMWDGASGHSADFCFGVSHSTASPSSAPCDCNVTNPATTGFCEVDGTPYRLSKDDFVKISSEFLHLRPADGRFTFDPIRGNLGAWSDVEIVDEDWLFYMHSSDSTKVGGVRLFELQMHLSPSGRFSICTDDDRLMLIGSYPVC
mgnify:FL=1